MKLVNRGIIIKIAVFVISVFCCMRVGAQKDSLTTSFLQQESVQLAVPAVEIEAIIFKKETFISYPETPASYSLVYSKENDQTPKWEVAPKGGFNVNKSENFQFKYIANKQYIDSDIIHIQCKKISDQNIESIELATEPSTSYPGQGSSTIMDQLKGSADFKDGQWLGFNQSSLTLGVSLKKKMCIHKISISVLQDQGAWIFAPQKIEIFHQGKRIGSHIYQDVGTEMKSRAIFLDIPISKLRATELEIRISALKEIPNWHPGKGNIPWLFIDEVIVE